MAVATPSLAGIGLYSVAEAAKLLRASTANVSRWANGYSRTYRGEQAHSEPLLVGRDDGLRQRGLVTFLDLMELLFIGAFRQHGVSVPVIRTAAQRAAELFNTDHPFAVKLLQTDGQSIFAILEAEDSSLTNCLIDELVEDLQDRQLVMPSLVRPYFHKIDYGMLEAERYWPMDRESSVVLDPMRGFGKPIDNSSGVPTAVLHQAYLAEESVEAAADWYEVEEAAVHDAIAYETYLRAG